MKCEKNVNVGSRISVGWAKSGYRLLISCVSKQIWMACKCDCDLENSGFELLNMLIHSCLCISFKRPYTNYMGWVRQRRHRAEYRQHLFKLTNKHNEWLNWRGASRAPELNRKRAVTVWMACHLIALTARLYNYIHIKILPPAAVSSASNRWHIIAVVEGE